jgi:hypothetical protein
MKHLVHVFSTYLWILLFSLSTATAAGPSQSSPARLQLHFFGSRTCGECMEIKKNILEPLSARYPDKVELVYYDIDDTNTLKIMDDFDEKYGVAENSAQELFFADTFLIGAHSILKSGRALIETYLERPGTWSTVKTGAGFVSLRELLTNKTRGWAFFTATVVAGLADGVNPCAIATMIFLISFLAMQKRRRAEVLVIGLSYTAAVYCTYFAMGFGLKEVFGKLENYGYISEIVRWAACGAAALVSALSFRDAFHYSRTGRTQDITLQLPKAVKLRIHKIISGNLGSAGLIAGAVTAGFLVTILEAICTGQMYVPFIVAMARHPEFRIKGLFYLAFYNFLFVLPLLIVMVLAYFGLKWNELAKATQSHMVMLKVLLGTVLAGLAVFLAIAG